ncbi:D-alanyl-D-alanine carboxypeptidase [Nodosilinea sp. LEGE 07088]|uniref:D-alanyl-D-alanine carboxypeptidase n=1 Tax=Nodosilinea sp. LEGE 07088 TaxID=2777968 RepID=UPI001882DD07|nr:D-alanyl-D-alanine carboxypeptidase [Nodosilinea sp. LEGE 07088]MBE9139548.1 D-alanyl-D-alanine carboxypeptidase [Nodosilinea sp. LEGE 07088]
MAVLSLLAMPLGLLSVLLGPGELQVLQPAGLDPAAIQVEWQSPWIAGLTHDPVLDQIVEQYLAGLRRQGWSVPDQGVWIQVGQSVITEHQGEVPLPAASLTKLATTLVALQTWPLDHRFNTRVGLHGTVQAGVLNGDLVIEGSGDPLFVWEEGIVLANRLQALGIERITGDVLVTGSFTMNFEEHLNASLAALEQSMSAERWGRDARQAYASLPPDTPQPSLQVDGQARWVPAADLEAVAIDWVIQHQSLPLVAILKAMNIYSNNAMAEMMADLVGGPEQVVAQATTAAELPPEELSLINGSGLGTENQMSARVAVAMTVAIQQKLSAQGFSVVDVLPVAGEDIGTLIDRRLPPTAAVKTGSLAEVSALAGMVPTAQKGPVWFAIINQGWDIPDLRVQQDQLLQAIQAHWGVADAPPELRTKVVMQTGPYRYGDPSRNQVAKEAAPE